MSDVGIVFSAELTRKLHSRIFWLASFGGVLVIAFIVQAPAIFASAARSSTADIVLAGPPALRERAARLLEQGDDFNIVGQVDTVPARITNAYLAAHHNAGALIALSVQRRRLHVDVYPRDLSAFDGVRFASLVPLNIELATGAAPPFAESATTIDRTVHPVGHKFADPRTATFAHGIAFGLIFLLYLAIILASQNVMSAVAEEKTGRIAEILVATLEPMSLLVGKTLASAALAIFQLVLWIATAAILVPQTLAKLAGGPSNAAAVSAGMPLAIDPLELVAFALFFLLGYLEYATVYAAAASLISRTEDLGSVTTPVILPVVGAFLVAQYALFDPAGPLVVALSFIPFLSPFVMFTRIAITDVPGWQIALAVVLNAATVAACFWAAGRIYRVGMLLYGKVPSAKQMWAVLRT